MNRKQVMGIITVSLIVGGTIYFIKKHIDSQDVERPITVEEAREIMNAKVAEDVTFEEVIASTIEVVENSSMNGDEIRDLVDEARDEVDFNASFGVYNKGVVVSTQEMGMDELSELKEDARADAVIASFSEIAASDGNGYDFYDGMSYSVPLIEYIKEEDKVLRFEPNTIQARDHFIKMQLAELTPGQPEYQIMKRLYDFKFEPLNDGDEVLRSQLIDHRVQFFGPNSVWNEAVSIADIITHYARLTDFELGEGVCEWILHFVGNTDFYELAASVSFQDIIVQMNQHRYQDPRNNTYSIFGLSVGEMDEARDWAQTTMDGEVTYEIEYNTFLKAHL